MQKGTKVFLRTEENEEGGQSISKVIEFKSGQRVQIPINQDGSVKWFDDSKLLKNNGK